MPFQRFASETVHLLLIATANVSGQQPPAAEPPSRRGGGSLGAAMPQGASQAAGTVDAGAAGGIAVRAPPWVPPLQSGSAQGAPTRPLPLLPDARTLPRFAAPPAHICMFSHQSAQGFARLRRPLTALSGRRAAAGPAGTRCGRSRDAAGFLSATRAPSAVGTARTSPVQTVSRYTKLVIISKSTYQT